MTAARTPAADESATSNRGDLYGLQALRVLATLLVIVGHSAISYRRVPLRDAYWLIYDDHGHLFFDYLCYWVSGIAMPLFFLLAGMSAAQGFRARGPRAFFTVRVQRLLVPLAFGLVTVVPLTYLTWAYGLLASGQFTLSQVLALQFPASLGPNLIGPVHLWYLEYLFLLSVAFGALLLAGERLCARYPRWFRWLDRPELLFNSPWKPLLFAVPTFLLTQIDWHVLFRLHNSFVPNLPRMLHYFVCFLIGAWMSRVRSLGASLVPHSTKYLLCALAVFLGMSPLLHARAVALLYPSAPAPALQHYALLVLASLFAWLSVLGLMGLCLRYCRGRSRALSYLAKASFWIYFCHLPVVGLMQTMLAPYPVPAVLKFVTVMAVALGVSLLSYNWMVQRTFIGQILNGGRGNSRPLGRRGLALALAVPLALLVLVGAALWPLHGLVLGHSFHPITAGLYRSARLPVSELLGTVDRLRLHSVVCLCGHPREAAEPDQCRAKGVDYTVLDIEADRPPPREKLTQLVTTLNAAPAPILLEDKWGMERTSLAAAVAELLQGATPRQALRQFDLKYGNLGHAPHREVIVGYQDWLERHELPHCPDRFRHWVDDVYCP